MHKLVHHIEAAKKSNLTLQLREDIRLCVFVHWVEQIFNIQNVQHCTFIILLFLPISGLHCFPKMSSNLKKSLTLPLYLMRKTWVSVPDIFLF
jgi:hypothetical protein